MSGTAQPPTKKRGIGGENPSPYVDPQGASSGQSMGNPPSQILGIPSYCLPTYTHSTLHDLSLPTSLDINFDQNGAMDPSLNGNFATGQVHNPPATYAQFVDNLGTSMSGYQQPSATVNQPASAGFPDPPFTTANTQPLMPSGPAVPNSQAYLMPVPPTSAYLATIPAPVRQPPRLYKKRGPAPKRSTLDEPFKQNTTQQIRQLGFQFQVMNDSMSAIQTMLQKMQQQQMNTGGHSQNTNTQNSPTSVPGLGSQPCANTSAFIHNLGTQLQHPAPVPMSGGGLTGNMVINGTSNGVGALAVGSTQPSRTGNNPLHTPMSLTTARPHYAGNIHGATSSLYTYANAGPRMSTGIGDLNLNFRTSRRLNSNSAINSFPCTDLNDPFLACISYRPSNTAPTSINTDNNMSLHNSLWTVANSTSQTSLTSASQGISVGEIRHCYQSANLGAQDATQYNDMSALLLPPLVRVSQTQTDALSLPPAGAYNFPDQLALNAANAYQNDGRRDERKIVSGGMPLGWNVDDGIKEDIWFDRFVDFADLLEKEGTAKKVHNEHDGQGVVHPPRVKKQIRTVRDWDRAFNTYLNLYVRKPGNLKHLPHLITYANDMKNMAENGYNFIEYDEQFRKERASQAKAGVEPWPWNVFRQDTYNNIQSNAIAEKLGLSGKRWFDTPRYFTFNNHQNFGFPRRNFSNVSNTRVPFGFCFDFHTAGKRCLKTVCSYRHYCPCGKGPHTMFMCRSLGNNQPRRPATSQFGFQRRFDAYPPRQS